MTTTQTKGERSIVELIFLQKDTEKMNLPAVGCNVGRLWRPEWRTVIIIYNVYS